MKPIIRFKIIASKKRLMNRYVHNKLFESFSFILKTVRIAPRIRASESETINY